MRTLLVAGLLVAVFAARYGLGPRFVGALARRDGQLLRSYWRAIVIRWRWRALARQVGLVLVDKAHQGPLGSSPAAAAGKRPRYRAPRIRICCDRFGVTVTIRCVPGVGLVEVAKQAQHLADAWHCCRVAVTQQRPGRIVVRAVRLDPLTIPTRYAPTAEQLPDAGDVRQVLAGEDEYARAVSIRLAGVSGIVVGGIPGSGKTSFILNVITRLAPSPAVQFVLLDGKVDDPRVEGDYADVIDRFAVAIGDDLQAANDVLTRLTELRRARSRSARVLLGSVNMWAGGPSRWWPLVFVIIDECQTYFGQVKDSGPKDPRRERNLLADDNARMVEDLVKKARSVGIIVLLATQKPTSDSIPTAIRDNCAIAICFAVKTLEAAKAVLGDAIKDFPEAAPTALQGPDLIGVASMAIEGAVGFLRVRTPWVPPEAAGVVATATASLCGRHGELPPVVGALELEEDQADNEHVPFDRQPEHTA